MKMNQLRMLVEMSTAEAIAVFKKGGYNPVGMSADELRKAWLTLIKTNHPDRGGDAEFAKQINAAYDKIKHGVTGEPERSRYRASRGYRRRAEPEQGDTSWSHAGYSGGMRDSTTIYRHDYRDINFIKKTMWEKSGKLTTQEWTVWGFDGHYFRGVFTVYGNPLIFKDMAEAMITWQTKGGNPYPCRAVFTQLRGHKPIGLVWADGVDYSHNPIMFNPESFNRNPGNDQNFVRDLPAQLDKLKAKHMMKNVGRGSNEDHRV